MKSTRFLFVLALGLLSGCAASSVNQNYGKAYEQMVREQTFDVSTRDTGQGDRVLLGTDPNVVNAAVQTMRKDTGSRADILSSFSSSSVSQSSASGGGGGGGSGGTGGSGSSGN
jgi:uncharacterized membrane protein YgcG